MNQHIPGYCGSCWAVGSITALADRISIARGKDAKGPKVHLSIQYILNCGKFLAGSCHGGTHTGAYHLVKAKGHIPYETCMPYLACSAESTEGFCQEAQDDFKCNAMNTCRTCSGFSDKGGECVAVESYPNATVAEYGRYSNDVDAIMAEIYARGPVAASINAEPLINYQGGVVKDHRLLHKMPNHVVAIIGWGTEKETGDKYWIGRNSWGEYWGEMGHFRVEMGKNVLGIESDIAWATPGYYTVMNEVKCGEGGEGCSSRHHKRHIPEYYVDPSEKLMPYGDAR